MFSENSIHPTNKYLFFDGQYSELLHFSADYDDVNAGFRLNLKWDWERVRGGPSQLCAEGVRFRARGRDVGEWTTDGLRRDCKSFLQLEERVYCVQL